MSSATLDRSLVERLVREALRGRLGNGHAGDGAATLPRAEKARAVMESIGTVRSRRLGQYRRRE